MTGLLPSHVLDPHWYKEVHVDGVDDTRPGLYEWRIEGIGLYIGQYRRARRPRREYGLNVLRLLTGRPYRRNKPQGFRAIHRELAEAVRQGRAITLSSSKITTTRRPETFGSARLSTSADWKPQPAVRVF